MRQVPRSQRAVKAQLEAAAQSRVDESERVTTEGIQTIKALLNELSLSLPAAIDRMRSSNNVAEPRKLSYEKQNMFGRRKRVPGYFETWTIDGNLRVVEGNRFTPLHPNDAYTVDEYGDRVRATYRMWRQMTWGEITDPTPKLEELVSVMKRVGRGSPK